MRWPAVLALLGVVIAPPALDGAAAQRPSDGEAATAHAALSPPEWNAIRKTVGEQLEALRAGDAARAYGFASAGIQAQFRDAPTFLRMVQGSYAPLLDARHVQFLEGAVIDGRTIQPLRLVMSDETVLVALYEMQRDTGGRWRIAGCVLAPSTLRST